jgi:hypothetical protein
MPLSPPQQVLDDSSMCRSTTQQVEDLLGHQILLRAFTTNINRCCTSLSEHPLALRLGHVCPTLRYGPARLGAGLAGGGCKEVCPWAAIAVHGVLHCQLQVILTWYLVFIACAEAALECCGRHTPRFIAMDVALRRIPGRNTSCSAL